MTKVSNEKGVWKLDANCCPLDFSQSLQTGEEYYFFDYSLTSGASWAGVIGKEVVTIQLDPFWENHELQCNQNTRLTKTSNLEYRYELKYEDPQQDLYFALPLK